MLPANLIACSSCVCFCMNMQFVKQDDLWTGCAPAMRVFTLFRYFVQTSSLFLKTKVAHMSLAVVVV